MVNSNQIDTLTALTRIYQSLTGSNSAAMSTTSIEDSLLKECKHLVLTEIKKVLIND